MADKRKLRVNDLVRIVLADGTTDKETLYSLTWLGEGPYKKRCCIRRAGDPLAGDREWDTSLLQLDSRAVSI